MPTDETKPLIQSSHVIQLAIVILGIIGNLLLGSITIYASRFQSDLIEIEAIARTGASNAALLARDVDNLTKWSVEEIRGIKERLRRIDDRK